MKTPERSVLVLLLGFSVAGLHGAATVAGDLTFVPATTSGPLDQWTYSASGTAQRLSSVVYGSNCFVAVGDAGTVLASPEGTTWTSCVSGTTNDLLGVTYGNNRFVAVGLSGTVLTSPDGASWTRVSPGTTNDLRSIAYGNDTFVAVGATSSGMLFTHTILTSPDGLNWTDRPTAIWPVGITYGNNQFVLTGWGESIATSPDGIIWTLRFSDWDYMIGCPAAGNNRYVVLGWSYFYLSDDGIAWCKWNTRPAGSSFRGITFAADLFVAVGESGLMVSSKDGINWTNHAPGTFQGLNNVAYGNNTLVVVGQGGTILQSAPLHPTMAPFLLSGRIMDGVFELTLAGMEGRAYALQSADDLSGSISWQTRVTLNLSNSPASWRDTAPIPRSQRFYRAVVLP